MIKPTREEVLEALAQFQRLWALANPEKGKVRLNGKGIDMNVLQESFNYYLKLNKAFHDGKYCRFSDSAALKGHGAD